MEIAGGRRSVNRGARGNQLFERGRAVDFSLGEIILGNNICFVYREDRARYRGTLKSGVFAGNR